MWSFFLLFGIGILLYRYIILENTSSSIRTLWIIDTSLSMAVEDIPSSENTQMVSRLALAKKLMQEGIDIIPGEHALISYAREASVETPFSSDTDHIKNIISNLTPMEFYGGSDLMSALSLASTLYVRSDTPVHIILLSDGGVEGWSAPIILPNIFSLSFIWLGTIRGGKIPLGYDSDGNTRYKYFAGKEVVIGYDASSLKNMSNQYNAVLIERENFAPFPKEIIPTPITDMRKLIFLALGTFCIIFWYFLHPYARKK